MIVVQTGSAFANLLVNAALVVFIALGAGSSEKGNVRVVSKITNIAITNKSFESII